MAFEIINHAQNTPMRVYALVRLVAMYPGIEEKVIYELLQPAVLRKSTDSNDDVSTDASENVLDAAVKCGLVIGDAGQKYTLAPTIDSQITVEQFRTIMQQRLLGVTVEEKDHFLLNIFAAWYAVLDEKVLAYEKKDFIAADFNKKIFPGADGRTLNAPKLNGMDDWLSFLGFGMKWDRDNYFLFPDATGRVEPILKDLLPSPELEPMGQFMRRLANRCPELDQGVLFERCWSSIYGERRRGNQLSLMLSTALRTLEAAGKIQLDRVADAKNQWTLFADDTSEFSVVTHISLG